MPIVVGKNVLESLTTGMYSDTRIIYREYIQNATDAIDKAVKESVLDKDENLIEVLINSRKKEVSIRDNGIGIPSKEVYNKLGDIGKSDKDVKEQRGFRGIGRLGGLGYCDELTFVTSVKGEKVKTITIWDCIQLRNLLLPNKEKNLNIIDLVEKVTAESTEPEKEKEHYFEVILTGIREGCEELLDKEDIKKYLNQVAPVPYNYQRYADLKKINEKLIEFEKEPEEYNVFLNKEQLYKPYRRAVIAGNKKQKDFIKEIEFFDGMNENNELLFLGWYGLTDLTGQIKEEDINGLRFRKHNIQIGDNHSLDSFFGHSSYHRFNRWFVGEIFIYSDDLIPNARRDNFEQNQAFAKFKKLVEQTTKNILCKLPYQSSQERSDNKVQRNAEKDISIINQEISNGVTSTSKERLLNKLENHEKNIKKVITRIIKTDKSEQLSKTSSKKVNDLKTKLLMNIEELKNKVEKTQNYKLKKIPTNYSREVRNVIKVIFEVIDTNLPEGQAQELQDRIIEKLKAKKKN